MDRCIFAIGGGELKTKSTLEIDRVIAKLVKEQANGERGNALFLGTASHDSMPYFNSFRKIYTSVFDIKVDCALMVYGEMDLAHIQEKIDRANLIYIGGGDTLFMLKTWEEKGFLPLLKEAYFKGTIIAGLSAGAIFHFETMYTDSASNTSDAYTLHPGLGTIKGCMCPHYNLRQEDFDRAIIEHQIPYSFAIEDGAAIQFLNEKPVKTISAYGNSYTLEYIDGQLIKTLLK